MNINGVAQEVVEAGYGKICLRDENILLLLLLIHKVAGNKKCEGEIFPIPTKILAILLS